MYACIHGSGNPDLLVECARQFSPHIEKTSSDTVLFDIRGLSSLFGDPHRIAAMIANRAGIPINVAISADPDAAVMAARGIRGETIITPGKEAPVLAPLSLNLLGGSAEIAELLDRWGLRNLGELAALPPLGVAARLGNEGIHLQRLAQGCAGRRIRSLEDPLRFEDELELDDPVELLEPLSFLLARLLNELCARLAGRGLATDEIRLALTLENAAPHQCVLRLPVPMRDAKTFLKLIQLELSARSPIAPVVKLRIEISPVKPRIGQQGLFLALSPEPAKLEVTLARLANLLDPENVGTPAVLNTNRPDQFRLNRFSATSLGTGDNSCPAAALTLSRFRPPCPAVVRVIQEAPAHITSKIVRGKVTAHFGPWQTSGERVGAEQWDHIEWDIAFLDGALYRIHENQKTGGWFLEGEYD